MQVTGGSSSSPNTSGVGFARQGVILVSMNYRAGRFGFFAFAANAFAANGSPVYLYRFSYVQSSMREQMRAGAPHGGEIGYVFGTLSGGRGGTPTDEDFAVSRMAQRYWVNFAKSGDPNGTGLPTWPRHVAGKDQIFDFRSDGTAGAAQIPEKHGSMSP